MSLILLLNPKQYGGTVVKPDTSDILDVYRKKRSLEDQLLEEEIAAQLLKKRQQDVVIPARVNKLKLANILEAKLYETPKPDEVTGDKRKKAVKMLLFALLMDD